MQYILDQDEYDMYVEGHGGTTVHISVNSLQKLCTKICDTMPVKYGWSKEDDKNPKPWGCIITRAKEDKGNEDDWACDPCPVKIICPYEHKVTSK